MLSVAVGIRLIALIPDVEYGRLQRFLASKKL